MSGTGLFGTHWVRKSDNTLIEIEGDSEGATGGGNRQVLARNKSTGRAFWVTPRGLGRNYYAVTEADS
jgi:hypothetical protein